MKKRKSPVGPSTSPNKFYTSLADEEEIQKRFRRLSLDLKTLLYKLHTDRLVFNYGQKVATAKPADLVRVLSEWSQSDPLDLTIRNIMVDTIVSSENKQIGSGIICALSLLSHDRLEENIPLYTRRVELCELKESINYFLGKGMLSEIANESLRVGALEGNIRFDLIRGTDFLLDSSSATKLDGYVHPIFESVSRRLYLPYIVCVDGIIESLGAVDQILQEAASSKCNVVICALGFHPDVVNTLNQNYKENRLKVVPFVVTRWNSDPSIDALSTCDKIGLTCLSREKGDVLSSQKLDNFSIVESVYLSSKSLAIQKEEGENIHVEIFVPKILEKLAGLIEDRIRITLQACTAIAKWGTFKDHDVYTIAKDLGITMPAVSRNAIAIGIKSSNLCKNNIRNLGAAVVPDIK